MRFCGFSVHRRSLSSGTRRDSRGRRCESDERRWLVHQQRTQREHHELRRIVSNVDDQSLWCPARGRCSSRPAWLALTRASNKRPDRRAAEMCLREDRACRQPSGPGSRAAASAREVLLWSARRTPARAGRASSPRHRSSDVTQPCRLVRGGIVTAPTLDQFLHWHAVETLDDVAELQTRGRSRRGI